MDQSIAPAHRNPFSSRAYEKPALRATSASRAFAARGAFPAPAYTTIGPNSVVRDPQQLEGARANRRACPQPRPLAFPGHDLFSQSKWDEIGHRLKLSHRELEVVRLCFDDLKESAIAGILAISSHTVHTHVGRLYTKLGVRSRTELLVRVFAESQRTAHQR